MSLRVYLEYFHNFTLTSDTPIQQETEVVILLSPKSLDSFDQNSNFTLHNTGVVCLSFPRMVISVVLLGDLDESKVTL